MSYDFEGLEPLIEEILSAPGTDLATISAKRVRKQLQVLDPAITEEFLKENRKAIDNVISRVFGQKFSADSPKSEPDETEVQSGPSSRKRRQSEDADVGDEEEETDDNPDAEETRQPPAKKAKKLAKQEMSDAELARQLSSEINGRARRTGSKPKATSGTSPKKRKTKTKTKSAERVVDSEDESDETQTKRPSKRKSSEGGGAKGGFAKLYLLSEPLAAVLGVPSLSRPQVVKQLWVYIKSNELQNPKNKREILCDGALRAVFNADKIDMFKMNKVLGQHLHESE